MLGASAVGPLHLSAPSSAPRARPRHPASSRRAAGAVRHEWAPGAFMVSFKLETDDDLVVSKARL